MNKSFSLISLFLGQIFGIAFEIPTLEHVPIDLIKLLQFRIKLSGGEICVPIGEKEGYRRSLELNHPSALSTNSRFKKYASNMLTGNAIEA